MKNERTKIKQSKILLKNIKSQLPELKTFLNDTSSHWKYEDPIYRFYHQSFKLYRLQETTLKIVEKFKLLLPDHELNRWFTLIVKEGTGNDFNLGHNENWPSHTRSILEAFFHAKFFLEMIVKYGEELSEPPNFMPSGWAAVLCLYNLR